MTNFVSFQFKIKPGLVWQIVTLYLWASVFGNRELKWHRRDNLSHLKACGVRINSPHFLDGQMTKWLVARALLLVSILVISSVAFAAQPTVLWVANSPSEPAKARLLKEIAQQHGITLKPLFIMAHDKESVAQEMQKHDMLIFDYVYMGQFVQMMNQYRGPIMAHKGSVFPGLWHQQASLTGDLSPQQAQKIFDYYNNGGQENFNRLFDYLNQAVFKVSDTEAQPPIIFPDNGIYHPDYPQMVFPTLKSYLEWKKPAKDIPVIGVGFHQLRIADDMTEHLDDLIRRIEKSGALPLAFYDPNEAHKNDALLYLSEEEDSTGTDESHHHSVDKKLFIDVMINFAGMYTSVKQQKDWMVELGIPVMQAMLYRSGDYQDYLEDDQGMSFVFSPTFIALPEIAGRITPNIVAVKRKVDEKYVAVPEQMDLMLGRALNYAKLRKMKNKDKKVTFVTWNSPDGEENFSASFLNIPQSLADIFVEMKKAGYAVPYTDPDQLITQVKKLIKPYYRVDNDQALRDLLKEDLAEKVSVDDYKTWLQTFPASQQDWIQESWGEPENNYLTIKDDDRWYFVIPRLKLGNIIVMPQPNRGSRRDREKDISHDKKVPLHHAYRAVYHYIVDRFKTDAIVHVGTHGTQEWLAGKERGLWAWDDSYSTIGSVPVVYPYSVANTGEALIAKRRGQAVVISHNTPPFAPAGLYGDLILIHEQMHQIGELDEGRVKEETRKSLVALVVGLEFHKDMNLTEDAIWQDYPAFSKKLHDYLLELAATAQPMGLHHYGSVAETDHLLLTVLQMLDKDYIQAADEVEPSHILAKHYEQIYNTHAFEYLKRYLVAREPLNTFPPKVQPYLTQALAHYQNFMGEKEIEHLLDGLAAKHIPTGTGNDPIRNPEAIPTGKNIYGFDPTKIPTKAAWTAGKLLAEDLIESYKTKHGMYPDKLAFSMWSTETLKHFGVLEAEVLYTMGVRPVWNERDQVVDVDIIPMNELKRPRIDVVLSATGLYRDNLPGVMDRLSKAIVKVASLKEPNNYLHEHTLALKDQLLEKGFSEDDAAKYSRVRFFANESGVYGTNLPDATLASDTWDSDESMVKTYLSRMGHLFGTEAGTRNVKLKDFDLFAENLKGTKAAILSRSSNLHGILSIDHPFEYLGGIGQAVRYLDGETPELYIANLRDTKNFKNDTAAEFIAKELRTRYYHPNWVKEMMDEGYSGALEILDVVNNFWGWNVMSPEAVRADQWQEMFEIYVEDKLELGVDEWFKEVQPAAIAQISERMLEAVRKDYWEASDETVKALVEKYMEVIEQHDVYTPNEKFKEFLETKAIGFGLDVSALKELQARQANPTQPSSAVATQETVQVEGIKLEKQPEMSEQTEDDLMLYWIGLALLLCVVAGTLFEVKRNQSTVGES